MPSSVKFTLTLSDLEIREISYEINRNQVIQQPSKTHLHDRCTYILNKLCLITGETYFQCHLEKKTHFRYKASNSKGQYNQIDISYKSL